MYYLVITVSSSEILQPPENNTLFLDQTAEFMCEIDSDTLVWKINGTERSNIPPEIRNDLVVRETITSEGSIYSRESGHTSQS